MSKKIGFCLALFLMGAVAAHASEGFDDLVKLIKSGIGEDVQIAYIDTSKVSFELTPDEILYLKDLGVNEKVITRVMQRGKTVRDGDAAVADAAPPKPVPADPFAADADLPPPAERVPELPLILQEAANKPLDEPIPAPPSTPLSRVGGDVAKGPLVNEPGVVDPVIGKPEPIRPEALNEAPPRELPEREVIREVVEKPVYVDRPVYIDRTVVTARPADRTDETLFYEALSPYGRWVEVEDAWYWQPTVVTVERGWKPYCNRGRWLYTDAGWTWQSEYSWGWAAFHYGRWDNHPRYGWIWHPDNVWGPAWVSWRSDDRYAGWAPLPRHARYETGIGFSFRGKNVAVNFNFGLSERDYCFVPVDRVYDERVYEHRLRPAQVTNVYNNTTVINNTYVYNDNRIINQGIPVDRVRQASHAEIRPTRIVDSNVQAGQPIKNNQLQKNELVVYRPTVAAAPAAESPKVVLARREAELNAQQAAAAKAAALKRATTTASTQSRPVSTDPRRTAEEAAKKPLVDATRRDAAPAPGSAAEAARRRAEEAARRQPAAEAPRAEARTEPVRPTTGKVTAPVAESRTTGNGREMAMDAQRKADEAAKVDQQRREAQARNDAAYEAQRKAEVAAEKRRDAEKQSAEARARQESETRKLQAVTELKSSQQSQAEEAAKREQARREVQARNDAALEAQRKSAAASAAIQARRDAEERARDAAEERARSRPQPEKAAPSVDTGAPRTSPPRTIEVAPPTRRQAEEAPRAPREERRVAPPPAPTPPPVSIAPPSATAPVLTPAEQAKQDAEDRREKARRK